MSGLVLFFEQHLPDGMYHYENSLAQIARLPKSGGGNDDDPVANEATRDEDADDEHNFISTDNIELTETPLSYTDWNNARTSFLYAFAHHRILGGARRYSADGTSENGYSESDSFELFPTSGAPEHPQAQQMLNCSSTTREDPLTSQNDEGRAEEPVIAVARVDERDLIPNVTSTLYDVERLNDIDLFTKHATLTACRVTKIWPLRQVIRTKTALARRQPLYTSSPQLPRLALDCYEDDGALSPCFREVLSVEIQQCDRPASTSIRCRAEALNQNSHSSPHRLRIFFYNTYAKLLQQLCVTCSSRPRQHQLYLSIIDAPSKCIIPYAAVDMFDQREASQCCLVVGDDSSMRIVKDDEVGTRVRFDDANMRIYLALIPTMIESNYSIDGDANPTVKAYYVEPSLRGVTANEIRFDDTPFATCQEFSKQAGTGRRSSTLVRESGMMGRANQSPLELESQSTRKNPSKGEGPGIDQPHKKRRQSTTKEVYRLSSPLQTLIDKYERIYDLPNVLSSFHAVTEVDGPNRGECIVNILGVVISFSPPVRTKRGDWMVGVALVDDSIPLESIHDRERHRELVVKANIFTKTVEALPPLLYAGDVLRLHRVQLQQWKGEMQLMGRRSSSYVVIRKSFSTSQFEYLHSSKKNAYVPDDKERGTFESMWKWGQHRLLSYPTMKAETVYRLQQMPLLENETNTCRLDEEKQGRDLTVLVTAVIPIDRSQMIQPQGFLRVWDGTGVPVCDPLTAPSEVLGETGDPPSAVLARIAFVIQAIKAKIKDIELDVPKAVTGRVSNVAVWEKSHWSLVQQTVHAGSFIRLRNVKEGCLQNGGPICLMVLSKSYLTPLPDLTFEVVQLLLNHALRLSRQDPLNPQSGLLPFRLGVALAGEIESVSCQHEQLPRSKCRHVTDLLRRPPPALFTGLFHIVGVIPSLDNIATSGVVNRIFVHTDTNGYRYSFGLRIRDESGDFDVILDNDAGEIVFGMKAAEAFADPLMAMHTLKERLVENRNWLISLRSYGCLEATFLIADSISDPRERSRRS